MLEQSWIFFLNGGSNPEVQFLLVHSRKNLEETLGGGGGGGKGEMKYKSNLWLHEYLP